MNIANNFTSCKDDVCEVFAEALWPTRCVICDTPGDVLCKRCELNLPYIDANLACPTCGAAYGIKQCTECNSYSLKSKDIPSAINASRAVVTLDDDSAELIRSWKDKGERRLGRIIAQKMAQVIPNYWLSAPYALVPIPASDNAYRSRGFDHIRELAVELSSMTNIPLKDVFERPKTSDQRQLGKEERAQNMLGAFRLKQGIWVPLYIILIDDVQTTGATLNSAATTLRNHGVRRINAITFARV